MIAPPSANDNGQEIKQYTEYIVPTKVEQFDDKTLVLTFKEVSERVELQIFNDSEQKYDDKEIEQQDKNDWKKVKKIIKKEFRNAELVNSFNLGSEDNDAHVFTSNGKYYLVCPGTSRHPIFAKDKARMNAKMVVADAAGGKADIRGFRQLHTFGNKDKKNKTTTSFAVFLLEGILVNGKSAVEVLTRQ